MAKRKRPSRATGVGRGNGPGSRGTQFQPDAPSRNPSGRPRKPKQAISLDLKALLRNELTTLVPVTENGTTRWMPQLQAIVKLTISDFPNASARERATFLKFLMSDVLPTQEELRDRSIPPQALAEFLDGLAKAHKDSEAQKGQWDR
jgi:hypothetical protein